jgi:uncharacterized protein (DUF362 family)
MIPVQKNLMPASADCVAIDAVAATLMGFDPMQIDSIRLAHEDGLGVGQVVYLLAEGASWSPHR